MRKYSKMKHLKEAEKYRDRIGDRLLHPGKVDPDKKHLIKDDIWRVKRILAPPFGKRVLDVGCSDGTVTIEIAKKWNCRKVIGVDISPSAIKEAKEKLKPLNSSLRKRISFLEEFIEDLDFPSNYFDTISACETLEHVGEGQVKFAMDNLVRMLKKNGNMIITVPNRHPATKYIRMKRDRWNWPTHHNYFTYDSLKKFLKGYFNNLRFYPLYRNDHTKESIYLVCNCWNKR